VSFSQDVNTRLVLARDNAKCLSLLESGRTAFKAKDWLTARDQFNEVATFSQDKKLLVDVSTIPDWLNRTNEEIRHVDEDKARELRHAEEKMARELLEQANKCVKSDKDHAIALLIKSAELGNTSSRAKLAHMYENPTDISIKGLYIGMKIDDAQSKLSALFKEKWIITAVEKQRDEGLHFAARKDRDFGPTVNVWADAKTRKVEQIRMDSGAVDLLFNVSDMDGKEFAQEVVSHYNIPEMKFEIIELNPGDRMAAELLFGANLVNRIGPTMQWQYKDPRGLVVAIEKDKTLVMKRIASAKDRKFD